MTDQEWEVVQRSRLTNALYTELLAMTPRLIEIAKSGIEDDLDPWCVQLFEHLLKEVTFVEASAKAELEGHMKKGKWG